MIEAIINPEKVPRKSQLNQITTGANIYIGDVIKLRQFEIAPCDMLILTASDELNGVQICRVDSFMDDGKMIRQVKEAVSLTKSFSNLAEDDTRLKDYLKRMYARVEYKRQLTQIKGTFKLKADPRIENFDNTMVIEKGTVLKSKFIIGLVLYNGRKCLGSTTRSNLLLYKTSSIQKKITMFSLVMIVINLITCVLLTLCHDRLREYTDSTQNPNVDTAGFLTFVSLFFSVMPLSVNILQNCFFIISASVLQLKYRELTEDEEFKKLTKTQAGVVPSELNRLQTSFVDQKKASINKQKKDSFRVLNPEVVSDLGDIDDAFFDKTGTLTMNKYEVKTVVTRNKGYESRDAPFCLNESVVSRFNLDEKSPDEMLTPVKKFRTFGDSDKSSKGGLKNKFINHNKPSSTSNRSGRIEINQLDFRSGKLDKLPFDDGMPLETENIPFRLDSESERYAPQQITPMKLGHPSTLGQPKDDKMYDESAFFSDLYYSEDLSDLLKLFTLCHNSTLSANR